LVAKIRDSAGQKGTGKVNQLKNKNYKNLNGYNFKVVAIVFSTKTYFDVRQEALNYLNGLLKK